MCMSVCVYFCQHYYTPFCFVQIFINIWHVNIIYIYIYIYIYIFYWLVVGVSCENIFVQCILLVSWVFLLLIWECPVEIECRSEAFKIFAVFPQVKFYGYNRLVFISWCAWHEWRHVELFMRWNLCANGMFRRCPVYCIFPFYCAVESKPHPSLCATFRYYEVQILSTFENL